MFAGLKVRSGVALVAKEAIVENNIAVKHGLSTRQHVLQLCGFLQKFLSNFAVTDLFGSVFAST